MRFNTDKPQIKNKLAGYNEEIDNINNLDCEVNITDQFGVIRGTLAFGDNHNKIDSKMEIPWKLQEIN